VIPALGTKTRYEKKEPAKIAAGQEREFGAKALERAGHNAKRVKHSKLCRDLIKPIACLARGRSGKEKGYSEGSDRNKSKPKPI